MVELYPMAGYWGKAWVIFETDLQKIVDKYTTRKSLGLFGEPRVNVLKVNLEIASIIKAK